jgi:hypothetical protein
MPVCSGQRMDVETRSCEGCFHKGKKSQAHVKACSECYDWRNYVKATRKLQFVGEFSYIQDDDN